jgi:TPR repeat protein
LDAKDAEFAQLLDADAEFAHLLDAKDAEFAQLLDAKDAEFDEKTQSLLSSWMRKTQSLLSSWMRKTEFAQLCQLAASHGLARAQLLLGNLHREGRGVAKDDELDLIRNKMVY